MDFNQQAEEYSAMSKEHGAMPKEHNIPEEYPKSVPSKPKKKRGLHAMMVYAFTGVWILYMLFGYLFPTIGNSGGDYDQGIPGPWEDVFGGGNETPSLPDAVDTDIISYFEEGLSEAADYFMQDDYIHATVAVTQCIKENYAAHGGDQIGNAIQVCINGTMESFGDQNLTGDKGVYIWFNEQTVYYEDIKDGTTYPVTSFIVTLIRVPEKFLAQRQVQILRLSYNSEFLMHGVEYSNMSGEASYLEASVDKNFSGDNVLLQEYSFYENDYDTDERYVCDGYAFYSRRRVEGNLENGKFCGEAVFKSDGMYLNESGTRFESLPDYADLGWMYVLNENGTVDVTAREYMDLTGLEYQSDKYNQKWDEAMADPGIYGVHYVDAWGCEQLYIKNLSSTNENAYPFNLYEWTQEQFPVSQILYPWSVIAEFI